jgi:nucleotide-binding universal stress UspA family protein
VHAGELKVSTDSLLADAATLLRDVLPTRQVSLEALPGLPATALLKAAAGAEAVVIGRIARDPIHASLGPVATAIVGGAPCPIFLVGAGGGVRSGPVIAAIERMDQLQVLQAALVAAALRAAPLILVHAWWLPRECGPARPTGPHPHAVDGMRLLESAKLTAAEWDPKASVSTVLAHGRPARELLTHAADACLLLIGVRRDHLAAPNFGSTGRELVSSPPCPLLLVAEHAREVVTFDATRYYLPVAREGDLNVGAGLNIF